MRLKGQSLALRRLFENQAAFDAGHTPPHKILAVGAGGGMCGIRVARELEVMEAFGLSESLTYTMTVSASGGPFGGFFSGVASRIASAFETLAACGFITYEWGMPRMHLPLFDAILRSEYAPLGIDPHEVDAHPTQWCIAVSTLKGKAVYLDGNSPHGESDVITKVVASAAMPFLCDLVEVNGVKYRDGGCCAALPIRAALERFANVDTVIVFQPRPHPKHLQWIEGDGWYYVAHALLRGQASQLRSAIANMNESFAQEAEKLALLRDVVWARLAPTPEDVPLTPLGTNLSMLRKAGDEAAFFMEQNLHKARPARQV